MAVLKADDTPFEILVVEDNPGDARAIQESLEESKYECRVTVAEDGEKALAILGLRADRAVLARPDLILLDLNLPKIDGREVLAEIKSDWDLQLVPLIVLTGSKSEQDILKTHELHANSYITKPSDPEELSDVLRAIRAYWLAMSRLPASLRDD